MSSARIVFNSLNRANKTDVEEDKQFSVVAAGMYSN